MTATDTEMTAATEPVVRSFVPASRSAVIVITVVGVVALNLLIYLVGRARGGAFTYAQAGKPIRVDAAAITLMSALPLTIGLTLIAWLSRRWPMLTTAAKVVGPLLAVATIWVMTVPARFDTTSTLCLATMHLSLAPATVLALGALARRR